MKILIAGDFCPIGRNKNTFKNKDFSNLFNGFEEFSKKADFSIVNFECPITNSQTRILKTGPCIKTEDTNSLEALKYAGFDLLTLANNHILDYDEKGVMDTIKTAKDYNFNVVGAGSNRKEASKPFLFEANSKKIGILNIAENEFCAASEKSAGAYTVNLIENVKLIKEVKSKVDTLILIYHGGREHYQLPTPDQRDRLRFFIDNGVDAIVAHHTHCFSGYEYYNEKPIVYSLGNFIFDYKKKYQKGIWTQGYAVVLNLVIDKIDLELIPYHQGRAENSNLVLFNEQEKIEFYKKIKELNSCITNDKLFFIEWQKYLKIQERFYLSSYYIRNLYLRVLFIKGILPISWLKTKHNKLILNLIRCETHHEISKDLLCKFIKKNSTID